MNTLWIYGILIVVMLLMIFIPGRRQKKFEQEQAMMRNSLQVGDEVTTIGGIIGKVTSLKGETVTIETSKDKTKIRFLRNAIRSVDVKAEESIALRSMPVEEPIAEAIEEPVAPAIEAAPLADESAKKAPKKRAPKAKAPALEPVEPATEVAEPVAEVAEAEAERTTLLNGEEISAE